ncbi:hypothetical protein [Candidatus Avelusimicrobium alvi]|jgi:hypothetical protein|uniref:hypothetical protein n=1 Tax=Candidatus Avelusimicrobium alvi TaxID=3416221 RepID=UPI003D0CD4D7
MMSIITILVFVVLLAVPGFYIITRKLFPKGSKKSAMWLSVLLTALLVGILTFVTASTPV